MSDAGSGRSRGGTRAGEAGTADTGATEARRAATGGAATGREERMPSAFRIGLIRGAVETKAFFRERDGVVFTFAFPIVLLVFFGAIFADQMGPVDGTQYYLPAMLAFGLMSVSFLNLGMSIAIERDDGTLKRLRGTPMPKSSYFLGKVILVLVVGLAEAAILIAVAALVLGVDLPTAPAAWATFAWVTALGIGAFTLLGIAVSSLPRSRRSAAAVINLPYILLQFISGVFVPLQVLPGWVRDLGAIFPPKWFNQGLQSVFLPDSYADFLFGGSWQHGTTALVLGGWCLGGLVLCLTTFRWQRGK